MGKIHGISPSHCLYQNPSSQAGGLLIENGPKISFFFIVRWPCFSFGTGSTRVLYN